jgi:MFS family permease
VIVIDDLLIIMSTQENTALSSDEKRSCASLATIYSMRMLGLFMVLPVFIIEARQYPGGDDPSRVGLAMGMYGLVQAVLQIPFGLAADRLGRKRVIVFGLLLLGLGSVIAACATSVTGLAIGRAIQGGGAISAAVTALLADQTRDHVRTKGMALIGASIGLMFALSLIIGPFLAAKVGLTGIFGLSAAMALLGILIIAYWTPKEIALENKPEKQTFYQLRHTLLQSDLLRLDFGVFVLYAVQLAMWVGIPSLITQAGVSSKDHGWVYLPAVLLSFVFMGLTLFRLERRGKLRPLFLASIVCVIVVLFGMYYLSQTTSDIWVLGGLIFLFFSGFNILEASQPSLASRMTAPESRGAVLGVYNTLQSLGIFTGGALGGVISRSVGLPGLFLACAGIMIVWLWVSWPMKFISPTPAVAEMS